MTTFENLSESTKKAINADHKYGKYVTDESTTKGDKPGTKACANTISGETNEKRVSLVQSEKAIISLVENLISKDTIRICSEFFSEEINEEFSKQIFALEFDGQKRNAGILRIMQERFFNIESGESFSSFKYNVLALRALCISEYKERFEAEKLKEEKRKAFKANISALVSVMNLETTADITKVAIQTQIDALTAEMNAL